MEPEPPRERVRVRKRVQPLRRRRSRSPWLLLPLAAVVLLLIAGGLLVRDLQQVRTSLASARSSLLEVREAAGGIQVDAAAAALDRADRDLAEARSPSGGPLWSIAARAPVLGGSITVTREVVRTASALVDVADQAVTDGARLLGDGLDVSVEDGRLVAMETVLTAIGDGLDVPGEVPDDVDLGPSLPADGFAEFAMIDVYEQLGSERSADRKLALRAFGDAAFARVFDGAWDGVAVSQAVGEAAAARHVQLYSRDEDEQSAFDRVGVAGTLRSADGADLLAVTANNAVGGKQDVHVGHRIVAEVTLDDPRRDEDGQALDRRADLQVEVDNPLPSEGMDEYIIGNCQLGTPQSACFDGPPGENRTWFTVWAPGSSRLTSTRDGAAFEGVRGTEIRGLAAYDRYLETPSQSRERFHLAYTGRAPAAVDAGQLVYDLSWWAQSKAIPTVLDVTVLPPEGWRIEDIEVTGGGSGQGFGAHGDGQRLGAEVDGEGRAQLTGSVTADTVLRVRMVGDDDS